MKAKYYIKNLNDLVIPKRANETDAGYDVIATTRGNIVGETWNGIINHTSYIPYKKIDYIEYGTNLYIEPQPRPPMDIFNGYDNFHTDLRPRSSISKYNLVLANSVGLIDRGYKNQILVRFKYIWQPEDLDVVNGRICGNINLNKIYTLGDKICQLVPMLTHDIEFQVMEHLDGDDRGGGFGSTGK